MHTGVISDAVLLSRHRGISFDTQALLGSRLLRALSHSRLPSLCRDWELQVDGGAKRFRFSENKLQKPRIPHLFRVLFPFLWPAESWLSAEGDRDRYDFFSNDRRVPVCKTRSSPGTHRESQPEQAGNHPGCKMRLLLQVSHVMQVLACFSGQQSLRSLPKSTGIEMIFFLAMTERCL